MKKTAIMKKAAISVMASLMTMSILTGCSSKQAGSAPAPGTSAAASSEAASAAGGEASSGQKTIEDVKAYGKLKVGCKSDMTNIGVLNPSTNEYEGYEIDVAYAIAGKIFGCTMEEAREKGLCEFTSVTAKTRGGLLDNGELDCVIASFTATDERRMSWNFTQEYRLEPVTFMVSKASGVETLADMDGFIIGVGQGTTTAELIDQYTADKGIDVDFEIQDFQYVSDGVAALKTGQIDAYSVDRMGLAAYLDDTLMLTNDAFGVQDIAIALKLGNDEMTEFMDNALTELKESGELDQMKEAWGILTDDEVRAME